MNSCVRLVSNTSGIYSHLSVGWLILWLILHMTLKELHSHGRSRVYMYIVCLLDNMVNSCVRLG